MKRFRVWLVLPVAALLLAGCDDSAVGPRVPDGDRKGDSRPPKTSLRLLPAPAAEAPVLG